MSAERGGGHTSRYHQETGIQITYGERSWRPIQSVIDILQNHLDAHSADRSAPIPKVKLRMTNGQNSQFIDYQNVKALSEDWKVEGFRVYDSGSGFDRRLLSMMGATTKDGEKEKRGGLGEGLKMSIAHLVRTGADIRLLSRNQDHLWIAEPKVLNEILTFEGFTRENGHSPETGSITDIDFRPIPNDDKAKTDLVAALDPRQGEGIGKYVLEFANPELSEIIDRATELMSYGIPGGRVYVHGLLVEETNEIIGSYNLNTKKALSGRDRKKVDIHALRDAIERILERIKNPEVLATLLRGLQVRKYYEEPKIISGDFMPQGRLFPIWAEAVREAFAFTPGEQLFAVEVKPEEVRFAREHGYEIIELSHEYRASIDLFEELFPSQLISLDQLSDRYEQSSMSVPENVRVWMSNMTDVFKRLAQKAGAPTQLIDHIAIEMGVESDFDRYRSSFQYHAGINSVIINPNSEIRGNFATVMALWIELSKAFIGTHVFNAISQNYLTSMAGRGLERYSPKLKKTPRFTGKYDQPSFGFQPYPEEKREKDKISLELASLRDAINHPDATKEDVTNSINRMKEIYYSSGLDLEHAGFIRGVRGEYFRFEDGVYRISVSDFDLKKQKTTKNPDVKSATLLLRHDDSVYRFDTPRRSFLPLHIQDGEVMTFTFITQDGYKAMFTIERKGNQIILERHKDQDDRYWYERWGESYDRNEHFILEKNVLALRNSQPTTITVERRQTIFQSTPETNRGKEFISSHMTVSYGREVWNKPQRILLDAIQNHMDANNKRIPHILFTVVNLTGELKEVDTKGLKDLEEDWDIIGVKISDEGDGYTTPYLTVLGKTTKGNADMGKYGEGLKLLTAACVRQGINVRLSSRDWTAKPTKYEETVKDYEVGKDRTFNMLGYHLQWHPEDRGGSETFFSLVDLKPGQTTINADQLHYVRNVLTDRFESDWLDWLKVLDSRYEETGKGIYAYVLPNETIEDGFRIGDVTLLPTGNDQIYEHRLKIGKINRQPMIFSYNVDRPLVNTRERNFVDEDSLKNALRDFYEGLTDIDIIKRILIEARDHPEMNYLELSLLDATMAMSRSSSVQAAWRTAFYEVFGEGVVLSLGFASSRRFLFGGALRDYSEKFSDREEIEAAIMNEVHIHNEQLLILPDRLSAYLGGVVTTSLDHLHAHQNQPVLLPLQDRIALISYLREANKAILDMLHEGASRSDRQNYATFSMNAYGLERAKQLLAFNEENLEIKGADYPARGEIKSNGTNILVTLNQSLLENPRELLEVYVHEMAHWLSAARDYQYNFQAALLYFAAHDLQVPRKSRASAKS